MCRILNHTKFVTEPEIILCHTHERLKAGDDQCLRKYCDSKGVKLTLIGLDQIANDILFSFPSLAKKLLGISIDSNQIFSLDDFIENHDKNELLAPLKTEFIFREIELEEAKVLLENNEVLLVTGPAGAGKTRFSLELCKQLSEEHNYTVLVIKNKNLQIHDDLSSALEGCDNYLVLVDDAEDFSELNLVVSYLKSHADTPRNISKLILTARNYEIESIEQTVMGHAKYKTINIESFSNSEIRNLIEKQYKITNPMYTNQIAAIADGNVLLAMLAGKQVINTKSFSAINDATDLYHNYYEDNLKELLNTDTKLSSAVIVAFIKKLNLDDLQKLNRILEAFGITEKEFISNVKHLNKIGIIDLFNEKIATISDQCLSNFLVEYAFVKKKIIPLSDMIETCFAINQRNTISTCNMLLNIYSNEDVYNYCKSQILSLWNKLEQDEELFSPFFMAFHMINPTKTLSLMKKYIDTEPCASLPPEGPTFDNYAYNNDHSYLVLQILKDYKNTQVFPTALDLLLLYYKKHPNLLDKISTTYKECSNIRYDSYASNYYTQNSVVKNLCDAIAKEPNDINLLTLFIGVAEKLLEFSTFYADEGRNLEITIYYCNIKSNMHLMKYRKAIWEQLYDIYQRGYLQDKIENILCSYGKSHCDNDSQISVVKDEFDEIIKFVYLFQPDNLYHCKIAEHINTFANKINYPNADILSPFLKSEKYEIYKTLTALCWDNDITMHDETIEDFEKRINIFLEGCTSHNLDLVIQTCSEAVQTFDNEIRNMESGLRLLFNLLKSKPQMFIYFVDSYMRANTPYDIMPDTIIETLFEIKSVDEVKKFISQYNYKQKNNWLLYFYCLVPETEITSELAHEMMQFLETTPETALNKSFGHKFVDYLLRYEKVEPQILLKMLQLSPNNFDKSNNSFRFFMVQSLFLWDGINRYRR